MHHKGVSQISDLLLYLQLWFLLKLMAQLYLGPFLSTVLSLLALPAARARLRLDAAARADAWHAPQQARLMAAVYAGVKNRRVVARFEKML